MSEIEALKAENERLQAQLAKWRKFSKKHEKNAKRWRKIAENMGYVAVLRELTRGD